MKNPLVITNRISNNTENINRYLYNDIYKNKLTPTEEFNLFSEYIKTKDPQIENKIFKHNALFVVSVSKQYLNRGLSLSDLISAGNEGLLKALRKFDPTMGFKFISYAVYYIRAIIQLELRKHAMSGITGITETKHRLSGKIHKDELNIHQEFQTDDTYTQLINEYSFDELNVYKNLYSHHSVLSMNTMVNEEYEFIDTLKNDENTDKLIFNKTTFNNKIKSILSDREYFIICSIFGLTTDFPNTFGKHDINIDTINYYKNNALKKLRRKLKINIDDYCR